MEHVGLGLGLFRSNCFLCCESVFSPASHFCFVLLFLLLSLVNHCLEFSLLSFLRSHCVSEPEEVVEFVEEVIAGILSDQEVRTFEEVIVPVFDIFQGRIKDLDLCQPLLYSYLDVLLYFSHHKDIAKVRRHTRRNVSKCCHEFAFLQPLIISLVSTNQVLQ